MAIVSLKERIKRLEQRPPEPEGCRLRRVDHSILFQERRALQRLEALHASSPKSITAQSLEDQRKRIARLARELEAGEA